MSRTHQVEEESKINSLVDEIKIIESESHLNNQLIESTHYLFLADLYHELKQFENELAILTRFIELKNADKENFIDIYERIERISQIQKLSRKSSLYQKSFISKQPTNELQNLNELNCLSKDVASPELSFDELSLSEINLVNHEDDKERITIVSSPIVKQRDLTEQQKFSAKPLLVLTVCAMFTGREYTDEIFQLALVLFEYDNKRDKKTKIVETFFASRKTKTKISFKKSNKVNLNRSPGNSQYFDSQKIIKLFQQADFVVGHNDADVERKLLSILIPEISTSPWYSSQKDIPWGALGFESRSLSQLSLDMAEKKPQNAMERAMAICKLIQKDEPGSTQTYLERLYHAKPMKPFEWTPVYFEQHNRLAKSRFTQLRVAIAIIMVFASCYYWFIN